LDDGAIRAGIDVAGGPTGKTGDGISVADGGAIRVEFDADEELPGDAGG
jgi:hypothetical protein